MSILKNDNEPLKVAVPEGWKGRSILRAFLLPSTLNCDNFILKGFKLATNIKKYYQTINRRYIIFQHTTVPEEDNR